VKRQVFKGVESRPSWDGPLQKIFFLLWRCRAKFLFIITLSRH